MVRTRRLSPAGRAAVAAYGHGYFAGTIPAVDHVRAHQLSSRLSKQFRDMYRPEELSVEAAGVIRVLNAAGVKFVLMGAHALGGWTRAPRATQDVDVLVQKSHQRRAIQALRKAYDSLVVQELEVVTRFLDPHTQQPVIDVIKPYAALHRYTLKHAVRVGDSHRVADLETSIANKFEAMIAYHRDILKRQQDAVDLALLVAHNKDNFDRARLEQLGAMVYAGGGKELLKHVDEVLAGRPLHI
jgi:hypothetical protein